MEKLKLPVSTSRSERTLGFIYLLLMLTVIPSGIRFVLPRADGSTVNFVFFCLNFICITSIFRSFLISNIKYTLNHAGRLFFPVLFGLGGFESMSILVSSLILYFIPNFSNINDSAITALAGQNFVLWVIGAVILVPIVEETLFRGLIFGSVGKAGIVWGYLVCALCFSAVHVVGYLGSTSWQILLGCFIQYLPAGICLAWSYQQSGSIFAPIIIHAIINAMGLAATR